MCICEQRIAENRRFFANIVEILVLYGWVAEWLCSGLQSRGRRFDSGPSLQYYALRHDKSFAQRICPGGEIGRRKGLKIPRLNGRAGSTPAPGTIIQKIPQTHL